MAKPKSAPPPPLASPLFSPTSLLPLCNLAAPHHRRQSPGPDPASSSPDPGPSWPDLGSGGWVARPWAGRGPSCWLPLPPGFGAPWPRHVRGPLGGGARLVLFLWGWDAGVRLGRRPPIPRPIGFGLGLGWRRKPWFACGPVTAAPEVVAYLVEGVTLSPYTLLLGRTSAAPFASLPPWPCVGRRLWVGKGWWRKP